MNSLTYHSSWEPLFERHHVAHLLDSLYVTEVYPARECVFRAFEMPVHDIRVVLIGQDPYHGPGQAHGLSFSVPANVSTPPSLRNMYKEIKKEYPERACRFEGGNLSEWHEREGILLLNASLTVVRGKPGSHTAEWASFTDDAVRFIAEENERCVFLLLGNFAKTKGRALLPNRVASAAHPSPLSARLFFGSGVFRKAEELLGERINWSNMGATTTVP